MSMQENKHYLAIARFYGTQSAARSQVPLIAHINQGLLILDALNSSTLAKEAFCLHPLLQTDAALQAALVPDSPFQQCMPDAAVVALAMEYRSVANAYLSQHYQGQHDKIQLSPIVEVNQMLIADKVQNRKDFEIYHLNSHANAGILDQYFKNWLRVLGVSEARYSKFVAML